MKKLFFLLMAGVFLSGCGTVIKQSEFWKHDSVYKNWDHLWFSRHGYKNPSCKIVETSAQEGWWGVPIPCETEE